MAPLPWFRVAVSGDSMTPALREGEWWLARRGGRPRVGDVVVVDHPEHEGLLAVKRLIRREPDGWWVEGDNPDGSRDSRHFGPIAQERIVGRLVMRYAPLPPRRTPRWLTSPS